ncbi:hypothetical protein BD560DRAFT_458324 [Blakeslea trispora]|nr:hypothetical protein BD560DRAFT_458324 [Blakeslea trispora]
MNSPTKSSLKGLLLVIISLMIEITNICEIKNSLLYKASGSCRKKKKRHISVQKRVSHKKKSFVLTAYKACSTKKAWAKPLEEFQPLTDELKMCYLNDLTTSVLVLELRLYGNSFIFEEHFTKEVTNEIFIIQLQSFDWFATRMEQALLNLS